MINELDLYSATSQFPLIFSPDAASYQPHSVLPPPTTIGVLYCHYSVRVADDVANSGHRKSYILSCRQRIIINNPTMPAANLPLCLQSGGAGMIADPNVPYVYANLSGVGSTPNVQMETIGYYFYPVWVMTSVSLSVTAGALSQCWLMNYQPRTLNSTVNQSNSSGIANSGGTASSYSNTLQKTSGSSNSTTQSYDVSVSVGAMYGLSASAGWGSEHTQDQSRSRAKGSDRSTQLGTSQQDILSDSMTIKDWGIYSCINVMPAVGQKPSIPKCTWFLSQEYPYNYLAANSVSNVSSCSGNIFPYQLDLTSAELANIFPQNFNSSTTSFQIAPPTELATLGGDFVQTSSWRFDTDMTQSEALVVTPSHVVDAMFASHFTESASTAGQVSVVGQFNPNQMTNYTGPVLDLPLLALDPIINNSGANGAVIGFLPGRFLVPVSANTFSRSISTANNLMVLTQGFTAPNSTNLASNAILRAALNGNAFSAQVNIAFKLIPFAGEMNLYLKHWVNSTHLGCTVSIWFNPPAYSPTDAGTPTDPATSLALPADLIVNLSSAEGASGDNNLLVVNLRNVSYDTVDYHDYLVPGLNVVVIGLSAQASSSQYSLRTVAVGS